MRKVRFLALGLLLLLLAPVQVSASEELLEFDSMIPVSGIFVGPNHPVRGLAGGGAPWAITEGQGQLSSDGELEVEVTGLIVTPLGFNPVSTFQVVVSCLTTGGIVVNVPAGTTPATRTGDAHLETSVNLPTPCNAPIVFVTSPPPGAPRWVAASSLP